MNTDFSVCPFCKVNMAQEGLKFVETGCTNEINYCIDIPGVWDIYNELNGQNPNKSYYACNSCEKELPAEYQEYFSKIL